MNSTTKQQAENDLEMNKTSDNIADDKYFKSEEFVSDLLALTSRQLVTVKATLKKHYNIDVNLVLRGE